jgi:IS30 family transposase
MEERYHIRFHFDLGLSLKQIAKALNRTVSTIGRKLRRKWQAPCKFWAATTRLQTVAQSQRNAPTNAKNHQAWWFFVKTR